MLNLCTQFSESQSAAEHSKIIGGLLRFNIVQDRIVASLVETV